MTNDSTGWTADVLFGLTAAQLEGIRGYCETAQGIGVIRSLNEELAREPSAELSVRFITPKLDRTVATLARLATDASAYGRGAQAAMRLLDYVVAPQ